MSLMTFSVQCLNSCTTNNTFQREVEIINSHLQCLNKAATTKYPVFAGVCLDDSLGTVANNTL